MKLNLKLVKLVSSTLYYKNWAWVGVRTSTDTGYKLEYRADGTIDSELSWTMAKPLWVHWAKTMGEIVNPKIDKAKAAAIYSN